LVVKPSHHSLCRFTHFSSADFSGDFVLSLSEKEMTEIREKVVRLETKVQELTKRVDSISKYLRDLYDYLQKEYRRPLM